MNEKKKIVINVHSWHYWVYDLAAVGRYPKNLCEYREKFLMGCFLLAVVMGLLLFICYGLVAPVFFYIEPSWFVESWRKNAFVAAVAAYLIVTMLTCVYISEYISEHLLRRSEKTENKSKKHSAFVELVSAQWQAIKDKVCPLVEVDFDRKDK